MIFLKTIKWTLGAVVGGPLLIAVAAALVLLLILLLVLPAWVEILVIQWERPHSWLRTAHSSCLRWAGSITKLYSERRK